MATRQFNEATKGSNIQKQNLQTIRLPRLLTKNMCICGRSAKSYLYYVTYMRQLFAGAALFALPALTSALDQNFYDEFCQNGQEVPSTPGWGAASFVRALPRPDNQGIATAAAENECGTARGTAAFSWASVTKSATGGSKGDSKFDVAAEQVSLCDLFVVS